MTTALEQLAALDKEIGGTEAERKALLEPQARAVPALHATIARLTQAVADADLELARLGDELRAAVVNEATGNATAEGANRARAAIKSKRAAVDAALEEITLMRAALAEVEQSTHPIERQLHAMAARREVVARKAIRDVAEQLAEQLRGAYRAAGELFGQLNELALILAKREHVGTPQQILDDSRQSFGSFSIAHFDVPSFPALSAFRGNGGHEMAIIFGKPPAPEQRFGNEYIDPGVIRAEATSRLITLGIIK